MNQFIGLGNVGKITYKTDKVIFFSLATSERYQDKQTGEWKTNTKWIPLKLFKPTEHISQKLVQGCKIFVIANLSQNKKDDGNYELEVIVKKIEILAYPKDKNEDEPVHDPTYEVYEDDMASKAVAANDDDLPF